MSEQIQAPTLMNNDQINQTNTNNLKSNIQSIGKERKLPRTALMAIVARILGSLKGFTSGNIGNIGRMASTQVLKTESMNYNILKQKLFETVSKEDMPCNKPRASTRPGKKKMVKACEGGKEKIVHFGDSSLGHNYSKKARKSFRARHKCGEKKSKLSAQYWACKNLWAGPKGSKKACPAGRQCKY